MFEFKTSSVMQQKICTIMHTSTDVNDLRGGSWKGISDLLPKVSSTHQIPYLRVAPARCRQSYSACLLPGFLASLTQPSKHQPPSSQWSIPQIWGLIFAEPLSRRQVPQDFEVKIAKLTASKLGDKSLIWCKNIVGDTWGIADWILHICYPCAASK